MKFRDILFIIKKRYLILILFPVIAGLVTAYYNFFMLKDMYQSQVTFIVAADNPHTNGEKATTSDLGAWQSWVNDFPQIITSKSCVDSTEEVLLNKYKDINVSSDMIAVDASNESRVIKVSVSYTDPNKACDIANELVNQFKILVDEKLNVKDITIIDDAKVNKRPVSPNRTQNIIMAVVAGLLSGAALCFLLEFTDASIKTNEDVEKHLGLPVLSRIPRYY